MPFMSCFLLKHTYRGASFRNTLFEAHMSILYKWLRNIFAKAHFLFTLPCFDATKLFHRTSKWQTVSFFPKMHFLRRVIPNMLFRRVCKFIFSQNALFEAFFPKHPNRGALFLNTLFEARTSISYMWLRNVFVKARFSLMLSIVLWQYITFHRKLTQQTISFFPKTRLTTT